MNFMMDCPFYSLDEYFFSHTIATYPFYEWWSVDLKINVISHRECNMGGKINGRQKRGHFS